MIFSKARPKPIPSLIPEGSDSDASGSSRVNPLKAAASRIPGLVLGTKGVVSEGANADQQHALASRMSFSDRTKVVPPVVEAHAAPVPAPHVEHRAPPATKPVVSERTSIEQLPSGDYLHFASLDPTMPDSYRDFIALIRNGSSDVTILCTAYNRQNHIVFDANERLRAQSISVSIVLASAHVIQALHDSNQESARDASDVTKDEQVAWDMIASALTLGASDIHLESRGAQTSVLFRINGERIPQPSIASRTAHGVCSAMYNVHADSNNKETHWDPSKVQDTVFERSFNGSGCQIRFHSAPIHPAGNFQVVMRLLSAGGQSVKPMEEIGYTPAQVEHISQMMSGSNGLLLTVGAVNSGKSTSMHSFLSRLRELRGETAKIVTVEDPVEYVIAGACQMGIPKGRTNLTDKATDSIYTSFLQATLREDTDIVMLGEIRNKDSASTVKDLVLTGRKTLSTLHVYEAFATFARLRELSIPESLLFTPGFISGIIYQKLLPTLCPHCALTMAQAERHGLVASGLKARIASFDDGYSTDRIRFRNVDGCEHCKGTGIGVRSICAEIIPQDEVFLSHLRAGDEVAAKSYWHSMSSLNVNGLGVTALAHGVSKMLDGLFDPRDVENQLGMLTSLDRPNRDNEDARAQTPPRFDEPVRQVA